MKKQPARRRARSPRSKSSAGPRPVELHVGRHLKLVARGGWESAERVTASGVAVIVAITGDNRLLLTEQFRPPVGCRVIELPAGLSGDVAGEENEELEVAARRELLEETGYRAETMEALARGPSLAGLTSEIVTFFRAGGLSKDGRGGGDGSEEIRVHAVALGRLTGWLRRRERAGLLVDPKIYAGLQLVGALGTE